MSEQIFMGELALNATSVSRPVFIKDLASSTGDDGKTGLVYNTAGLVLVREILTEAAPTVLTLSSLASLDAAYTSGGFLAFGTDMPGWYRLDFPNGCFSVAGFTAFELKGAAGMRPLRMFFNVDNAFNSIRDKVLNRVLPGNHDIANSTSKLIQTAAAYLGGTGVGARTVTVTVQDLVSNPISGAAVRMTKGGESYVGTTGVTGQLVFNLNDGTWIVSITKTGYQFGGATLVVDGTETPVYSMDDLLLTESLPGLTTGYLTAYSEGGIPEAGVEIKSQAVRVTDAEVFNLVGISLDKTVRVAVSDSSGLVEFPNLFKGVTYNFRRGTDPVDKTVDIPVDAGPSYQLPIIFGSP